MEMTVEKVEDVAIVEIPVEELDASNAGEFKRDMAPVLEGTLALQKPDDKRGSGVAYRRVMTLVS